MPTLTPEHQLGRYIISFQGLERILNEILIVLADVRDREVVTILVHELEFGRRVATADVLFSHVIRTSFPTQANHVKVFHKLTEELVEVSKFRNTLVHSHYDLWIDITGRSDAEFSNSRLKPNQGMRIEETTSMMAESFETRLDDLRKTAGRLLEYLELLVEWFGGRKYALR
ncbi:hypothetical protein [Janthinobacterium lividum]|uniref:hypothetical protein n=1 Tax=Janthinobacterium lividum TaxID=29581 RepID=UPI001113FA30|nr:hypothetical protein [Janthinobacterium lividum]